MQCIFIRMSLLSRIKRRTEEQKNMFIQHIFDTCSTPTKIMQALQKYGFRAVLESLEFGSSDLERASATEQLHNEYNMLHTQISLIYYTYSHRYLTTDELNFICRPHYEPSLCDCQECITNQFLDHFDFEDIATTTMTNDEYCRVMKFTEPLKDTCSICLETMESDKIECDSVAVRTPCGHTFHDKCLRQQLCCVGPSHCPLCRKDLRDALITSPQDI